jgi:hypothetical protein
MQIKLYDHCFGQSIEVEGKPLEELTKEEMSAAKLTILQRISESIDNGYTQINEIIHLIEYDDYDESPNYCGQCGSNSATTTWNL